MRKLQEIPKLIKCKLKKLTKIKYYPENFYNYDNQIFTGSTKYLR